MSRAKVKKFSEKFISEVSKKSNFRPWLIFSIGDNLSPIHFPSAFREKNCFHKQIDIQQLNKIIKNCIKKSLKKFCFLEEKLLHLDVASEAHKGGRGNGRILIRGVTVRFVFLTLRNLAVSKSCQITKQHGNACGLCIVSNSEKGFVIYILRGLRCCSFRRDGQAKASESGTSGQKKYHVFCFYME